MNKAIGGNGWAQSVGADGLPVWASNMEALQAARDRGKGILWAVAAGCGILGALVAQASVIIAAPFILGAVGAGLAAAITSAQGGNEPLFQVRAKAGGLEISSKWTPARFIRWDELARVEVTPRKDIETTPPIPLSWGNDAQKAESIRRIRDEWEAGSYVTISTADADRIAVYLTTDKTDCGRLAHSIRSYVETQRGNAAPSPVTASSPAADGFDL